MSILVIILTDIAMHIREYKETEALYSSSTQSDTQLQRKTVFCHTGSKKCEIVDLKTILNTAG